MDAQSEPPQSPQLPQSPRFSLLLALPAIFFFASTLFLAYQNLQFRKEIAALRDVPAPTSFPVLPTQPVPLSTIIPTINTNGTWVTYNTSDHDVKVSFKVPQRWFDTYGNVVEQSFAGEKGLQYCLTLTKKSIMKNLIRPVLAGGSPCSPELFGFGGLSKDYVAGRGSGFTDTNGFLVQNSKYYYLMNLDRNIDISEHVIDSYTNPQGIQFIIIDGADEPLNAEMGGPASGTPGAGSWGALVNVPSGRITGLAIQMKKSVGDEKLFRQILASFTFLEE